MDRLQHQLIMGLFCLAAAACGSDGRTGRAEAAVHVDSIVPRDVELARFRAGLTEPAALTGGAPSREALVRRFMTALEHRDTSTLGGLLLTRAEFAYLYYPTNPEAKPPYDLSPGLMWFMMDGRSRQGLAHALEDRGGLPLHYLGHSCTSRSLQGENTVWAGCVVRRRQGTRDVVTELLFGPIVQRDGRYKFVSYSNKL